MPSRRESFARRLSDGRKRTGLTQLQLAERLDVSRRSIIQWEDGEREPREVMQRGILAIIEELAACSDTEKSGI